MLVSVIVDLEMFLSKLILSCKLYFNLGQRFHFKYPSTKITGDPSPKMRLVAPLDGRTCLHTYTNTANFDNTVQLRRNGVKSVKNY